MNIPVRVEYQYGNRRRWITDPHIADAVTTLTGRSTITSHD